MALVVQRTIVLHSFVVKSYQVLSCRICDLLLHLGFELLNSEQHRVNLHLLDRVLGYLALQDHSLLFVLLVDLHSISLQVLDNHRDAVVGILIHHHVEHPRFASLNASPVHSDLVIGRQTVINFLEGRQTAPGLQLGDVFDFGVCLEQHQVMLRDDQVNVHHLLAYLASLLTFLGQLQLDLLLTGEHATLCTAQPKIHIVVKVEMEASEFANRVLLLLLVLLNSLRDEHWDLLDYLVQVHRWAPLSLAIGKEFSK